MEEFKKQFRLRLSVYVTYTAFALILLLLFAICQYGKAFFIMYATLQSILSIIQLVCLVFIGILLIIVFTQYHKAGVYAFYQNGIKNVKTDEMFFYNDIMTYHFVPQNNKQAKALRFETDDKRTDTLTALLPPEAFEMFQVDHAAVWKDFMIERINNKHFYTIEMDEDLTSFKMKIDPSYDDRDIVISHEGIVLYNQFYAWHGLKRVDVSWSGMFSIKDVENKTVFLEPMTSIPNYHLFVNILTHYIEWGKGSDQTK